MGLNFFDVMGQLTEGRGGKFVDAGDAAGVPAVGPGTADHRGIPARDPVPLQGHPRRLLSGVGHAEVLHGGALKRFAAAGIVPAFDHDLWPLLHRDALWAYYSTLVRSQPGVVRDPAKFLDGARRGPAPACAQHGQVGRGLQRRHCGARPRRASRLDLRSLAAPLAGRSFGSRAELDAAVVEYLLDDARRSALGEDDPVKMAIGALHHGRAVLKSVVADGGITDESWVAGLRGWFESFVEGLASGPPALRAEQLAALARAGVVSFVGPDPKFGLDRGARASSRPLRRGSTTVPPEARTMVEALAPANRVAVNESPLLEQLLADGLVRPADHDDRGGHAGAGLGAGRQPASLPSGGGQRRQSPNASSCWACSSRRRSGERPSPPKPSSRPARLCSGQRTLRDADEIARAILGFQLGTWR